MLVQYGADMQPLSVTWNLLLPEVAWAAYREISSSKGGYKKTWSDACNSGDMKINI